MAFYENVFIARQEISAAQVDALADQFTNVLTENGGAVKKKEYWGLKSLAYRIKKNRKGHYVLLNIDAPAAAVHEMERQMRINEDILRFLTVRVDELEEGPSAMLQSRGREDRPRRFDDRPRRYEDRGPRHEPVVQAERAAVEG
jgi:small subunit ribosomal protein S6